MTRVACTNYDCCECGHQRGEHFRQLACKIDSCQCQRFVVRVKHCATCKSWDGGDVDTYGVCRYLIPAPIPIHVAPYGHTWGFDGEDCPCYEASSPKGDPA